MEGGRLRTPCLILQSQLLKLEYDVSTRITELLKSETINFVCTKLSVGILLLNLVTRNFRESVLVTDSQIDTMVGRYNPQIPPPKKRGWQDKPERNILHTLEHTHTKRH
jgi:hypothetical protein